MTPHQSERGPGGDEGSVNSVSANLQFWDSSDQRSVEKAGLELPNEHTRAVKTSKQVVLEIQLFFLLDNSLKKEYLRKAI